MVGNSLGYRDHAEVACGVLGYGGCGMVGVVTTLSPHEARLILASMGQAEGAIRPGLFTGEQKLDVLDKLRACAAMEDGEK